MEANRLYEVGHARGLKPSDSAVSRTSRGGRSHKYSLDELLYYLKETGGSDLHLNVGVEPCVRLHGHIRRIRGLPLTADDTKRMLYALLRPDAGSVSIDGVDAVAEPIAARRRLGGDVTGHQLGELPPRRREVVQRRPEEVGGEVVGNRDVVERGLDVVAQNRMRFHRPLQLVHKRHREDEV